MSQALHFVLAAALALACTSSAYASPNSFVASNYGGDAARIRLMQAISDAKTELVADAATRAAQVQQLAAAQSTLVNDLTLAQHAADVYARLSASAGQLRTTAYDISNMPGLSASQNHKSVAAMEAADAAENVARTAQFNVAATASAVVRDSTALDRLTAAITALDQRMVAYNQLVKTSGAALEYASRPASVR